MRLAWAIPCARVRARAGGLLDLLAAPIDSVVVEEVPKDIQFDVAMRLVGTVHDFEEHHLLQVVLSDPQLEQVGVLEVPIAPRSPKPDHIPGYEINHNAEFASTSRQTSTAAMTSPSRSTDPRSTDTRRRSQSS